MNTTKETPKRQRKEIRVNGKTYYWDVRNDNRTSIDEGEQIELTVWTYTGKPASKKKHMVQRKLPKEIIGTPQYTIIFDRDLQSIVSLVEAESK